MKMQMSKDELKDLVREAQDKLFEVIEMLNEYVHQTDDGNASAYVVDHLIIMASRDHGFCSRDLNLDDILDRIEEELDVDDDDDGDDDLAEYAASSGNERSNEAEDAYYWWELRNPPMPL